MPEIVINPADTVATSVSVFTVDPVRQRELVELLTVNAEKLLRHQPGFLGAGIHASLDGTRVLNYMQWRDEESARTMLANPEMREHLSTAKAMASVEPVRYKVESVHRPRPSKS